MTGKDSLDFNEFEKLLLEKPFSELSATELKRVREFVADEQEYEELRLAGTEIKNWLARTPIAATRDKVLPDLVREFNRVHQRSRNFSGHRVFAGYAAAAVVFGLLGWWLGQMEKPTARAAAERVLVYDTIYLPAKPDTIFSERVIFRTRSVIRNTTTSQYATQPVKGVSMKEKEELDKLLVSGSEE